MSNSSAPQNTQRFRLSLALGVLGVLFAWCYWPTFCDLVAVWNREPDYSHGYLVVPVALGLAALRRVLGPVPAFAPNGKVLGISLIVAAAGIRLVGDRMYPESLDGWSMIVWLSGLIAIMGGTKFLVWALPPLAFLVFMVPLPYRIETALSVPLQTVATHVSTWMLQLVGQPAIAEGHTIWLAEHELEVAGACSGLRMFTSVAALAVAIVIAMLAFQRPLWHHLVTLLMVAPVAVLANSLRIAATGLGLRYLVPHMKAAQLHDMAGLIVIPLAAVLYLGWLLFFNKLFIPVEPIDFRSGTTPLPRTPALSSAK